MATLRRVHGVREGYASVIHVAQFVMLANANDAVLQPHAARAAAGQPTAVESFEAALGGKEPSARSIGSVELEPHTLSGSGQLAVGVPDRLRKMGVAVPEPGLVNELNGGCCCEWPELGRLPPAIAFCRGTEFALILNDALLAAAISRVPVALKRAVLYGQSVKMALDLALLRALSAWGCEVTGAHPPAAVLAFPIPHPAWLLRSAGVHHWPTNLRKFADACAAAWGCTAAQAREVLAAVLAGMPRLRPYEHGLMG
jgi:hypothetical protein